VAEDFWKQKVGQVTDLSYFLGGPALETVVRSQRITWLEQEAARVRQEMNAVAARTQKEIGKLRREEFGIKKELRELRGRG
jgi:hypothetical protein